MRQVSLSSSEEELASTPEYTSCDDVELESESVSEKENEVHQCPGIKIEDTSKVKKERTTHSMFLQMVQCQDLLRIMLIDDLSVSLNFMKNLVI